MADERTNTPRPNPPVRPLLDTFSLGELLAVVAAEASEHPFIGSESQKNAWDEIKKRFRVIELERNYFRSLLREGKQCLSIWQDAVGEINSWPAQCELFMRSATAALKEYEAEVARFTAQMGDE